VLLGEDAGLAPLKELLIRRTEGNPFFLEESVRTLVETGALDGERGAHRLAAPVASTQMPATVQAVLAARIDRLAPEDKRLLQTAAVIGKDVPYTVLQEIGECPEDALRQTLARLQEAEFLYETSVFGTTPLNRGYAASARAGERGCLGGRPRRWGATQAGSGT
jgi:predicted ATPase